jgi:hypothetical protein
MHVQLATKLSSEQENQSLNGQIITISDFEINNQEKMQLDVEITKQASTNVPKVVFQIKPNVLWMIETILDNFLTAGTMQWNKEFSTSHFYYLNTEKRNSIDTTKAKQKLSFVPWSKEQHYEKLKSFYREFHT